MSRIERSKILEVFSSVAISRFGFLEGIWYLDIVHNGHVPKASAR